MRFRSRNTDGLGIHSSRGEEVGETCTRDDAKVGSQTVDDSNSQTHRRPLLSPGRLVLEFLLTNLGLTHTPG